MRSGTWSFVQHLGDVVAHGLLRHAQSPGDLVVAAAGGQQFEHLALARGQVWEGAGGGRLDLTAGVERDDPPGDGAAVHGITGGDGTDGADDLLAVGALDEVAAGAGAQRGEDVLVVLVHGEHEDRQLGLRAQ